MKEQLEQKEEEVKNLQEKLVCKMKGEGVDLIDRGKEGGTVFIGAVQRDISCITGLSHLV